MSGRGRTVALVAAREWGQRTRSLAFRISTAVSILIVVGLVVLPQALGAGGTPTRTVGLVGSYPAELPSLLRASGHQLGLSVRTRAFVGEAAGRAALRSGGVSVLLVDERTLVWKSKVDSTLEAAVTSSVQVVARRRAVASIGLTPAQAAELLQPPRLRSATLEPARKEDAARIALATIGVVLLMMALAFYGGFVLTGVIEEKSNRVVEVLLSRIGSKELLTGKVLGIGLVGLVQFALVAAAAWVALRLSGNDLVPHTAPSMIAWTVVWFVLGYAFYSVMYATVGSLVSRQEEAQGAQFPVTAILLVGYFLALQTVGSPDGVAALVGSFLPPTAPMVMTVRIAEGAVPWWQILASVALVAVSVLGLVQLAGRVYAGAVLRFGRRVRLREAWRGRV